MRSLAVLYVLSVTGFAGLNWQATEIQCDAVSFDKEAIAVFKFSNDGKTVVNISDVEVTCDCLSAEPSKRAIAPGERGEITVYYAIEGRSGIHKKTLVVVTDDPATPKTVLRLEVSIEAVVRLEPRVLWWKIGDEKKPQSLRITVKETSPTVFSGLECADPNWKLELKVITAGREYVVEATPRDTSKAAAATFTLKTNPVRAEAPPFTGRLRVQ